MTLVRLLARTHRTSMLAWWLVIVVLAGATISSYFSTYASDAQRRTATSLAQGNAAATLIYGALPDPGTPGQMFAWEMGAVATILVGVMGTLLAVDLIRVPEEDGTLELVRATGATTSAWLWSAVSLLLTGALALAAGCGLAIRTFADTVTWRDAFTFGAVVGTTFLLVALIGVVAAQVAPTASLARLIGLGTLVVAFVVRGLADTQHMTALNWLSPLGIRATVRPFTSDRWLLLVPYLVACAALAAVAARIARDRELGAAVLPTRNRSEARLSSRSCIGLAVRLERGQVLVWTIALAGFGALFTSIGSGVVTMSRNNEIDGGFLSGQLGAGDPVAAYFAYLGTFVGILVSTFAVLVVLRAGGAESRGLTGHALTAGTRRWAPLAAQFVVAAAGSLIALAAAGGLVCVVAPHVMSGDAVAVRGFAYLIGQWPSALAMAGLAGLAVGLVPRLAWLAWVPLGLSAALALLGPLLELPQRVIDLGVFRHVPDIAASPSSATSTGTASLLALATLMGVGALAALLGNMAIGRRDTLA